MTHRTKTYAPGLLLVALLSTMTACGGGSGSSGGTDVNTSVSGTGGDTSDTQIQGIATPSSVAVVTATNAQ